MAEEEFDDFDGAVFSGCAERGPARSGGVWIDAVSEQRGDEDHVAFSAGFVEGWRCLGLICFEIKVLWVIVALGQCQTAKL